MKYRITKYNPIFRDNKRNYIIDTWTSYSDIYKHYSSKIFTAEEYLRVETNYIKAVLSILMLQGINEFKIKDLEIPFSLDENIKLLNAKGLDLPTSCVMLFNKMNKIKNINIDNLQDLLTLILRECLWCKLYSESSNCVLEIGYDFYVYITGVIIPNKLINTFKSIEIYIENV